ncbi:hypothetical protein ACFX5U_06830 [Sphingobacterium sp. SG20118]|uniref:hypothetical protein n=1 Tax=Sphingobacterium sp. SG20118 TaxID=3367156 RepID=UPI0037DFC835
MAVISDLNPRKTATERIIAAIAKAIAPTVMRTINLEKVLFPKKVILLAKKYGKFKLLNYLCNFAKLKKNVNQPILFLLLPSPQY